MPRLNVTKPANFTSVIPLVALLISLGLLGGCKKTAPITKYQAPKDEIAKPAAETKGRTLAAMVPQGERVWFFKLQGADEGVAKQTEAFETFVSSLDFSNGQPDWKLPEGWKEGQGSGMRFATINTGQPGFDVSVISLPAPQELLANANRWRGELQLKDWTEEEVANAKQEIKIGDDVATVFDIAGTLSAGGRRPPFMGGGAAPFAGGANVPPGSGDGQLPAGHPPIEGRPPIEGPPSVAGHPTGKPESGGTDAANPFPNPGFEYTKPEGWEFGQPKAMRSLAFNVADGKAEFTVIALGMAAGELQSNVDRWRGEVGLEPVKVTEEMEGMSDIKVAGQDAKLFDFVGEEEATSVVMAVLGQRVWFYKLKGDATTVADEKEKFLKLIESIKL